MFMSLTENSIAYYRLFCQSVDASIIPSTGLRNMNDPKIVIAEKAVDMVLSKTIKTHAEKMKLKEVEMLRVDQDQSTSETGVWFNLKASATPL